MSPRLMRARLLLLLLLVGLGLIFLSAATRVAADDGLEVVATGLDNPRDLTFGPDGALYIAEAGRGNFGLGGSRDDLCFEGPEGEVCFGPSGAVTRVMDGVQERVVSGMPSIGAIEDGSGAAGPHSVAFDADGNMVVLVGLGADPALRDPGGPLAEFGMQFGQLALVDDGGGWTNIVDVAAYEASDNPDGGVPDSNPFAILAADDGYIAADAGGNDLLHIDGDGVISTLAVFPEQLVDDPFGGGGQIPMQAVPTSVVMGPDGAYYIGQLTGFPFPVGGASVFRLEAGGEPEVYATGFTNILGLDFDAAGNLYVLEMAMNSLLSDDPTGALVRVTPSREQTVVTSDLFLPTGLVIGDDGYAYISNGGILAGGGAVVRILVEEPTDVSLSGFDGGLSGTPLVWLAPLAVFVGLYLIWQRRRSVA